MNTKKDKQPLSECDLHIKEIRLQLNDQVKHLEQQNESRTTLVNDIQEFLKRKSEVESEYAKKLDVLSEKYLTKHKNLFGQKKDQAALVQSSLRCWLQMLEQCQRESKDHNMIASVYTLQVLPRLQVVGEDVLRLHKKNREVVLKVHEDFLEDLRKLYQALQVYQTYWTECMQAEKRFKQAEKQLDKRNEKTTDSSKEDPRVRRSSSLRKLDKQRDKRMIKYSEAKLKCIKARNEYILQLEATNATLDKYYGSDMGTLLDTVSLGYHNALERMWDTYCEAETAAQTSRLGGVALLKNTVDQLDPENDKNKFVNAHLNSFSTPSPFVYMGHVEDDMKKVSLSHPQLFKETERRCKEMEQTLKTMAEEQNELKNTLSSLLVSMRQLSSSFPCDVVSSFVHNERILDSASPLLPTSQAPQSYLNKEFTKVKNRLIEMDSQYVEKTEEYLQKSNQLNRLEARHKLLSQALLEDYSTCEVLDEVPSLDRDSRSSSKRSKKSLRRKHGKSKAAAPGVNHFSPKLAEYLQESSRALPLPVESCIRVINLYGLHHQGIFRVPGSHQELLDLKSLYEKGEDPILEQDDKADINTVAGLLKLYFRELDEKLFPQHMFDELMKCAHIKEADEKASHIRKALATLPPAILIVMRYLFAFLHHLSENSDENMMDAYNIAVCFGPTLLPVPDAYDQVSTQANVNEIIKTVVLHHEEIFPQDLQGFHYEKMMSSKDFEGATPTGNSPDNPDPGGQSSASDDESEQIQEAVAKYDYKGRSERELSFVKGDLITLYKQASDTWWEGSLKGKDGLVPHAYIAVQDSIDGAPDRVEPEPSGEVASTISPIQRSIPTIIQPIDRKPVIDVSRRPDPSRASQKTRSLDRYNNVQDYMRQQKTIASIASKAAQHGLARAELSSSKRSSSMRQDKVAPDKEEDTFPGVDPMSLSVRQKIAQFRKSTKGPKGEPEITEQDAKPDEGERTGRTRKSSLDSTTHDKNSACK